MKIEEGRQAAEALGTPGVDETSVGRSTKTGRPADSRDPAQIPSDVHLVCTAVSAVAAAPAIRTDRVDAARKAVAAGSVGRDPWSIAERLIDNLLER